MSIAHAKAARLRKWAGHSFKFRSLLWMYLIAAILPGAGLMAKASLLQHLLPLPVPLLMAGIACCLALPLAWPLALRYRSHLAVACLVGVAFTLLFIYPRVSGLHAQGRGSDQPDCIIVAGQNMMHAAWPYDISRMWTHNPMSCGPGWVAIQAPLVHVAGYRWDMLALWALAAFVLIWSMGWETTSTMLTCMALSPGLWLCAANGTDFLSFGIAVAALIAVSVRLRRPSLFWALATALVAQFRFATLLLPACIASRTQKRYAWISLSIAACTQIGFLLWNPASFVSDGPLHLFYKLTRAHLLTTSPGWLAAALAALLALAALCTIKLHTWLGTQQTLLLYFTTILFVPAMLNLAEKYRHYASWPHAFEYWEGSIWIAACLPLTALYLATGIDEPMQAGSRRRVSAPELPGEAIATKV